MIDITFIEKEEGLKLRLYDDATGRPIEYGISVKGNPTIGYGHKVIPGESFPDMITKEHAEQILHQDIAKAIAHVREHITVSLNDNQLTALVSLVFNCGQAPLSQTIGHLLQARMFKEAADFFLHWDRFHNRENAGLKARRMRERDLFLTPVK